MVCIRVVSWEWCILSERQERIADSVCPKMWAIMKMMW